MVNVCLCEKRVEELVGGSCGVRACKGKHQTLRTGNPTTVHKSGRCDKVNSVYQEQEIVLNRVCLLI